MSQKLVLGPLIEKFSRAVAADSQSSAKQYASRLHDFDGFLLQKYDITIDQFVKSYKRFDIYDVLSEYHIHLQSLGLQKNTISTRLMTAKTFLEFNDIPINNTQFRLKVRAPRHRLVHKEALSKDTVRRIILACQSPRLHTYVISLAATGMRAAEALSIRYKDVDWDNETVFLRAEYTKMKVARTVLLTKECMKQFKFWKDYRQRERKIVSKAGKVNYHTKELKPNDLFFSTGRFDDVTNPAYLYHTLADEFGQVLDRIGLSEKYDNKGNRHRISLHSFRSFVKTTISDLGYQDFSEYFIGHAHSTYYQKPEVERLALFHKIEPYLTYLDYSKLEARGADIETKISEKDQEMEAMKQQFLEYQNTTQEQMNAMREQIDDILHIKRNLVKGELLRTINRGGKELEFYATNEKDCKIIREKKGGAEHLLKLGPTNALGEVVSEEDINAMIRNGKG